MLNIKEKIEKLPFLPEIVFELQSLQKQKDFDHKKILTLIEKDSFVSAKILEMANSKLFGFNNSVKTVSKALSLFGATFTIAIAISESIKNSIKINLDIYNIQAKRFFDLSEYSCKIMLNWLDEEDVDLKEKLFLPCLIHEIGKFIISDTVHSNKKEEFIDLCNSVSDISSLERNFVSYSSSEVTSLLLKKWNFDNSICEDIYYIDSHKNKKI
jgi:HD-like signal output (HDOD) protein